MRVREIAVPRVAPVAKVDAVAVVVLGICLDARVVLPGWLRAVPPHGPVDGFFFSQEMGWVDFVSHQSRRTRRWRWREARPRAWPSQ